MVLLHQVNFQELLERYMSDLQNSKVTLTQFHHCQMNCLLDVPADIKQTDLCRLFFMTEFLTMLRRHDKAIGDDQLQKEVETIMDNVPGPRFTRNMLSGTSFENICD